MKHWLLGIAFCAAGLVATRAAEENFSKMIRPEDFTAAGLEKLSPAERARLDALVRDFKSGAIERANKEAAAAEARAAKAEAKAQVAAQAAQVAAAKAEKAEKAERAEKEKKSEPSLLARAKVLLTPGTEIEYTTVESRIAGQFRGWESKTIFTLENGQRWQVVGADSYVIPPTAGPAVKIAPGMLGTFWMTFEGIKGRAKVALVSSGK